MKSDYTILPLKRTKKKHTEQGNHYQLGMQSKWFNAAYLANNVWIALPALSFT